MRKQTSSNFIIWSSGGVGAAEGTTIAGGGAVTAGVGIGAKIGAGETALADSREDSVGGL
jgi:hypothetical protein